MIEARSNWHPVGNASLKYYSNRAVAVAGWMAVVVISRYAVFLWVPAAVGEAHTEEGTTDGGELLCCTTTIDQECQLPDLQRLRWIKDR